jgi:hypothetical protein
VGHVAAVCVGNTSMGRSAIAYRSVRPHVRPDARQYKAISISVGGRARPGRKKPMPCAGSHSRVLTRDSQASPRQDVGLQCYTVGLIDLVLHKRNIGSLKQPIELGALVRPIIHDDDLDGSVGCKGFLDSRYGCGYDIYILVIDRKYNI